MLQKLYQIARANAGSQLIAKKPMNVIRNRYRDVLPSKLHVSILVERKESMGREFRCDSEQRKKGDIK